MIRSKRLPQIFWYWYSAAHINEVHTLIVFLFRDPKFPLLTSLLPTPYSLLPTQGCQSTVSPIWSHLI
ncbi:MAG: hypothetical protein F6J98_42140 [Moorea sp. SIO4G2]|nr:hypothetical protein [Moorena sp. SIO4G2]